MQKLILYIKQGQIFIFTYFCIYQFIQEFTSIIGSRMEGDNQEDSMTEQLGRLSQSKPTIFANCLSRVGQIISHMDARIDLNKDEVLSIVCYTSPLQIYHAQNYQVLPKYINRSLRMAHISSNGAKQNQDWIHSYSNLLASALSRLPTVSLQQNYFTTYRGVSGLQLTGEIGETMLFRQFLSTSKDKAKAVRFIGRSGTGSILTVRGKSGRDVSQYSYYKTEEEVVYLPLTSFQIITKDRSRDIWEIELRQR